MKEEIKRDYKKEWEKETSRLIKIDKDLWKELDKKLKDENKSFTGLVTEAILKYLHEEKENNK